MRALYLVQQSYLQTGSWDNWTIVNRYFEVGNYIVNFQPVLHDLGVVTFSIHHQMPVIGAAAQLT